MRIPLPRKSTFSLAAVVAFLVAAAPLAAQTTHVIRVSDGPFGHFEPNDMYIQVGDTVQWDYVSGMHDIVAVSGAFSSGPPESAPHSYWKLFDMGVIHTYPVLCNEYRYECTVHGEMGAVTVLVPDLNLQVSNLVAGSNASFMIDGATPNKSVRLAYSPTGPGPTSVSLALCGLMNVALSPPIVPLVSRTANMMGMVNFSLPVPAGTTGLSVWFQAVDMDSCRLSNSVAAIVG